MKVKLLKRSPKGVELTSAGKLVVDQSKKVFWTFEGMASSLRPFIRKEEGVIKIFANYGAAIDFLPYDLAEYMAVHNEISSCWNRDPLLTSSGQLPPAKQTLASQFVRFFRNH